jgi:hypothetical protein
MPIRTVAHPGGWVWNDGAAAPINQNLKNTDFIDKISEVLGHVRFSLNQPIKSADHQHTGILKK